MKALYCTPTLLNVSCSEMEGKKFSVMIFDLTGKLLVNNTTSSPIYEVDLSNFSPAVSLVKVYDE
jgi:hypothetical protein